MQDSSRKCRCNNAHCPTKWNHRIQTSHWLPQSHHRENAVCGSSPTVDRTPPCSRRHAEDTPRHVHLSIPCYGSVYCISVRMMKSVALFPRFQSKQLNQACRSTTSCCTTRTDSFHHHDNKPKLSLEPCSGDKPHQSNFTIVEPLVAICCKSRCPTLSLPQASPLDVVPHRTNSH